MTDIRTPSLARVLNALRVGVFADLRVACPARVERYDSSTQLIDAQPMVKDSYETVDGSTEFAQLPVICNVPLCFPGSGGFRVTFPVAIGDTVLLIFADRSIDAWQSQGILSTPADERRHHLTDAFAIPGLHPNTQPHQGAESGAITIGADTGVAEFVATGQKVLAELQKIQTTFNAHVHAGVTTGPGSSGPPATPITGLVAPESATVKIRG